MHGRITRTRIQIDKLLDDFRLEHRASDTDLPREIREILDHINVALFDSRLNVRFLKTRCRMRDNNISCRFHYVMGATIKEYVEGLRLEAAELLLHEETISIFDVGASVGYYYPQTFYRAFHRKYDCTPAVYRSGTLLVLPPAL